jgi:hypothetical protein
MSGGISISRSLDLQGRLTGRAADIFSQAVTFKLTSEDISQMVAQRLQGSPEWKRTPQWVHSYVQGYMKARRDNLYTTHLEWLLWLDGRLVTSKSVAQITKDERTAKFTSLVQMCEESVLLYQKQGGSCRTPPTLEEFDRDPDRFFPSDYMSPWRRVDADKSRHVWKDAEGNPLPDKPFDRKWR